MAESDTRRIVQQYIDALLAHDEESAFANVSENAEIVVNGRNALSGAFTSPDHYRQIREWMFREHDGAIDVIACELMLADDSNAVAIVTERAHRDTGELTYERVMVFRVNAGKIIELRMIAADPYALDSFWA